MDFVSSSNYNICGYQITVVPNVEMYDIAICMEQENMFVMDPSYSVAEYKTWHECPYLFPEIKFRVQNSTFTCRLLEKRNNDIKIETSIT